MAEIVNLNTARKAKARRRKEAEAEANRARFGRTKAEKIRDLKVERREQRDHDGKRLERDEDPAG